MRVLFVAILCCFISYAVVANSPADKSLRRNTQVTKLRADPRIAREEKSCGHGQYAISQLNAGTYLHNDTRSVPALFIQAFILGLLAVFTPYVYTIHPFTIGYLTRNAKTGQQKMLNLLVYAASLIMMFTLFGVVIALLIKVTGLQKYTDHWIFNFYLCRTFIVLGITFLGGITIKLPTKLINSMADKAGSGNFKGLFFMAATLPFTSASSTFPLITLVLLMVLYASNLGVVMGFFGFALGLALPFVFPAVLNIFSRFKSMLNNIKAILGFISLMIGLKFLSRADISLGWNLLGRDTFIVIWMGLWGIMGVYMLGFVKLSHDVETEQNIYGQEYIALSRLFIGIFALVFALYLLPGLWGAPLHGVSSFLPAGE